MFHTDLMKVIQKANFGQQGFLISGLLPWGLPAGHPAHSYITDPPLNQALGTYLVAGP
jgi:hypothetical protein